MINIEDLTIGQTKQLQSLFSAITGADTAKCSTSPWEVGENYLIRTVSMTNTGKLVQVTEHELVLSNAAWIADTGRFADNLISCSFNEVEPFPKDQLVIIGRGSIVDAVQIKTLPTKQK